MVKHLFPFNTATITLTAIYALTAKIFFGAVAILGLGAIAELSLEVLALVLLLVIYRITTQNKE